MDEAQANRGFRDVMSRLEKFVHPVVVEACEGLSSAHLTLRPHDGGSVNVTFRGVTEGGVQVAGDTRLTVSPRCEVTRDSCGAPWGFAEGTAWNRPRLSNERLFEDGAVEVEGEKIVTQREEDAICAGLAKAAVEYFEANPLAMAAGAARRAAMRAHAAQVRSIQADREAASAAVDRAAAEDMVRVTVEGLKAVLEARGEPSPAP